MPISARLEARFQRFYVAVMLQVVGRALAAASRVDEVLRAELCALPVGYVVQLTTPSNGPRLALLSRGDGTLDRLVAAPDAHSGLAIRFKHLAHAFLVLSFQEGTAQAFANDRMVADGDVALATRLVRCLDRLETLILPKLVAARAVKRHRPPPALEKLGKCVRIYANVAGSLLGRN